MGLTGDDRDRQVLVPVDSATVDEDRNKVVTGVSPSEVAKLPRTAGLEVPPDYGERFRGHVEPDWRSGSSVPGGERHMTRSAEEVRIGKRRVPAGEVTVRKHVETERVRQPVSRQREEVDIERRPVSERTRGQGEIREDEVRVPLTEEEVVVEKRPVVKEELVVGKKTVEEKETIDTDVRREEFDIERGDRDRENR
ncbi:MAG: DUF2382 domain-containing protein [Acidobacteria bacterium]|nr:MAG: DUF2382 domain-containing protein [Acidobacteriota bacterium]